MDVINVIKTERKQCVCCMEEHDVSTMRCRNKVAIKGVSVEYDAIYEFCENDGGYWETGEMITANHESLLASYRATTLPFYNKLDMIRQIYGNEMCVDEPINIYLKILLHTSIKNFYQMFGANKPLLSAMYQVKSIEELVIEDDLIVLADEHQAACQLAINTKTWKPVYLDTENGICEELDQSLEDFLIWISAIQGIEYLPCAGTIGMENIPKLNKYATKISEDVWIFDNLICVCVDDDIFLAANSDKQMETFEKTLNIEVNYF